jgi:hypothetical protein
MFCLMKGFLSLLLNLPKCTALLLLFSFEVEGRNQGHSSPQEAEITITGDPAVKNPENERPADTDRRIINQAEETRRRLEQEIAREGIDPQTREGYQQVISTLGDFSKNYSSLDESRKEMIRMADRADKLQLSTETTLIDGAGEKEVMRVDAVTNPSFFGATEQTNAGQIEITKAEQALIENKAQSQSWSSTPQDAKAVTLGMLGRSFATQQSNRDPGIQQAPNSDQEYQRTLSGAEGVAGRAGGSGSGVSLADRFDADRFTDRARDLMGVPSGGSFDLANNPLYSAAAGSPIQSALQNMAFSSLSGEGANQKQLSNLLGTPGFQDMSRMALGPEGASDLNLLAAGAEILSNPDLPELGKEISKDYIASNLSSAAMIENNASLSLLSQSVGLGSLAQLSPETLRWLAVAGDLAFEDLEKIPEKYRSQREIYKTAFNDLRAWLAALREHNALNELDTLKLPVNPDVAKQGWKNASKKFIETHFAAAQSFQQIKEKTDDSKRMEQMLRRIGRWWQSVPEYDLEKTSQWASTANRRSEFSKQWHNSDHVSLKNARFYHSRLYYYGTLPQFFSGSQAPINTLVKDAQEWGHLLKLQERRRSRHLAHQRSQKK